MLLGAVPQPPLCCDGGIPKPLCGGGIDACVLPIMPHIPAMPRSAPNTPSDPMEAVGGEASKCDGILLAFFSLDLDFFSFLSLGLIGEGMLDICDFAGEGGFAAPPPPPLPSSAGTVPWSKCATN